MAGLPDQEIDQGSSGAQDHSPRQGRPVSSLSLPFFRTSQLSVSVCLSALLLPFCLPTWLAGSLSVCTLVWSGLVCLHVCLLLACRAFGVGDASSPSPAQPLLLQGMGSRLDPRPVGPPIFMGFSGGVKSLHADRKSVFPPIYTHSATLGHPLWSAGGDY